ncbi:type II secretion system protein [Janthinobacterium fluminis]|uniref:Type II secretion system protein n=1 Tax=Janthinobacterium fluminis TaxID=2987524 RepID=A0ABT5K4G3_9BURK|nr:type II secretion system protein [Janthinobacterium fluminis]MDC8759875.1 type II secretion system protein [Janthinobacterium fluminis]
MSTMHTTEKGFSLVEMAIVLVVVGFMIGGLITPLAMQIEQRKVSETNKALEEARESLIGYAVRNGYLPCPAVSATNGLEDRRQQRCANEKRLGYLPWATLGLAKSDAWNHLFLYSVTPAFSDSGTRFSLNTPRDISVMTRDGAGRPALATASKDIPALILSHGKNGYGAGTEQGGRLPAAPAGNADERINAGNATTFVSRALSEDRGAAGGEFDDIVVWLSPNILLNRMVAAQRLPQ